MPSVIIRLMDAVGAVLEQTTSAEQRQVLARQAGMILRLSEESVLEANDRADIRARYQRVVSHLAADARVH